MTATVDLEKVKELIDRKEFIEFLLLHSKNLEVPVYVLFTLHSAIELIDKGDKNMNAMVDLEKVKELIESDEFAQFLISHSTDLGIPLYVLQTLHEAVEQDAQSVDNK